MLSSFAIDHILFSYAVLIVTYGIPAAAVWGAYLLLQKRS